MGKPGKRRNRKQQPSNCSQGEETVLSRDARGYIPKSNGAQRPLSIPTMHDRAMQALYLLALDPVAETMADPNSYGFRTARSAADAMEACFIALCHNNRAEWILEGDIRSCFDKISHEWLVTHIPMEKGIIKK